MYSGTFVDYVFDNVRNITIAGALTYLWSLGSSPVGYTALMGLLRSLGITSSGVLYQVINRLISKGLVERVDVGTWGTRVRYVPTRHLILELLLDCPWESRYGCFDSVALRYDGLKRQLGQGDPTRRFIEWLEAITGNNSSSQSPLRYLGYPRYFWDVRGIRSYWGSRDEYMRALREDIQSLLSDPRSEWVLLSEFRSEYVMDLLHFYMWLGGGKISDADLPARVTHCYDEYTMLFVKARIITDAIQEKSQIMMWLSDSDGEILMKLLDKAKERARREFEDITNRVRKCLDSRYSKQLRGKGSK